MNEQKPVYLTQEGLDEIKTTLTTLIEVQRPALAKRLHFAIKQGDLSENADYISAKEEQGFLEGKILELQNKIRNAQIIEAPAQGDGRIRLGNHVTVQELGYDAPETYHLVGPTEADPRKGKISHESPLGKALLGHVVGDRVGIHAPGGEITFEILEVC